MSFYFNGAQANVTISGSIGLPQPTATQTPVIVNFSNVASGATIYTVTAGKTFYLYGLSYNCAAAVFVTLAGVYTYQGVNQGWNANGGGVPMGKFTAGTNITVANGGTNNNYGTIWGYEA